jgi:hypothetical protein
VQSKADDQEDSQLNLTGRCRLADSQPLREVVQSDSGGDHVPKLHPGGRAARLPPQKAPFEDHQGEQSDGEPAEQRGQIGGERSDRMAGSVYAWRRVVHLFDRL